VGTVNPGGQEDYSFDAPVNLGANTDQRLQVDFSVSPQAGGVKDRFSWWASFYPYMEPPELDESGTTALHDGRSYVELERHDEPGDLAKKKLRDRLPKRKKK
jgi:hypothetical protein